MCGCLHFSCRAQAIGKLRFPHQHWCSSTFKYSVNQCRALRTTASLDNVETAVEKPRPVGCTALNKPRCFPVQAAMCNQLSSATSPAAKRNVNSKAHQPEQIACSEVGFRLHASEIQLPKSSQHLPLRQKPEATDASSLACGQKPSAKTDSGP